MNRATREQCVRLIQVANGTLGMCMQLKGCNNDAFSHHDPVTGGSANDDGELQMVWWTLVIGWPLLQHTMDVDAWL